MRSLQAKLGGAVDREAFKDYGGTAPGAEGAHKPMGAAGTLATETALSVAPAFAGMKAMQTVSKLAGPTPLGIAGGLIGGFAANMVASGAVSAIQDKALQAIMGPERYQEFQATRAASQSAHPAASWVGRTVPFAATFKPSVGNLRKGLQFAASMFRG